MDIRQNFRLLVRAQALVVDPRIGFEDAVQTIATEYQLPNQTATEICVEVVNRLTAYAADTGASA